MSDKMKGREISIKNREITRKKNIERGIRTLKEIEEKFGDEIRNKINNGGRLKDICKLTSYSITTIRKFLIKENLLEMTIKKRFKKGE